MGLYPNYLWEEFHFSDVYDSVDYIGSRAKRIKPEGFI